MTPDPEREVLLPCGVYDETVTSPECELALTTAWRGKRGAFLAV